MGHATSSHSVQTHLGVDALQYDEAIRQLVPFYDEFLSVAVSILNNCLPEDAKIVDLGAGTGGLTAAILDGLPKAQVELIDVDAAMLNRAKERFASQRDRVTFRNASFFDELPRCDAYVASLSLHHIHDLDQKTEVYRSIRKSLKPGSIFLNLDAVVSDDPRVSKMTYDVWVSEMESKRISRDAAREHLKSWEAEDRYFAMHQELTALAQAGFAKPECFWRRGPMAVYGGIVN